MNEVFLSERGCIEKPLEDSGVLFFFLFCRSAASGARGDEMGREGCLWRFEWVCRVGLELLP